MLQVINMNITEIWWDLAVTKQPNSNLANSASSYNTFPPSNLDEYDGIFISPLTNDIHNFPLPPNHKIPNFEMFSCK